MTDVRTELRKATAARADAQSAWAAASSAWDDAVRAAVKSGMTLSETADLAGVTRGRVAQIVGPTGRSPGRRKRP